MIAWLQWIGLTLSPVAIASAASVVWVYRASFVRRPTHASDFLILGIFVGFLGKLLDNSVWLCFWTLHQVDNIVVYQWLEYGAVINIFTRQIPLVISASCHLYAAKLMAVRKH